MANFDPLGDGSPIRFIQPGGGFCFGLELFWGRVRRSLLRTFFPGYVKRMESLRRGECPGCTHSIIDSRDLKNYANVCGYYFDSKTDPYHSRNHLAFARWGAMELLVFSFLLLLLCAGFSVLALLVHPAFWVGTAVSGGFWVFVLSFFRNPKRKIPEGPGVVVSPADGTITNIEEVDEPGFGKALRISIFLSVFNVHVNRSPMAGTVERVRYFPGEFLDARSGDCSRRNEQLWLDMKSKEGGFAFRVKQIAGAIARRIVCQTAVGRNLAMGELYGMIKFGSRTDLLLPPEVVSEVAVQVGQKVRGGSTILLTLQNRL